MLRLLQAGLDDQTPLHASCPVAFEEQKTLVAVKEIGAGSGGGGESGFDRFSRRHVNVLIDAGFRNRGRNRGEGGCQS